MRHILKKTSSLNSRIWPEADSNRQNRHPHWQSVHQVNNDRIAEAFETTLVPALDRHAIAMETSSRMAGNQLQQQCDRGLEVLSDVQSLIEESNKNAATVLTDKLESILQPSLQDHAGRLEESTQSATDRMEQEWERWQSAMVQWRKPLAFFRPSR